MSSRLRSRLAAWQHAVEREVAPHVEEDWAEAALLELRLRGVAGPRIGSVLAEVDSHCAESGQSAQEAFGEPVEYVRSLELPIEDPSTTRELVVGALPTVVQTVGMLTLLQGVAAWRTDAQVEVTVGAAIWLPFFLAVLAAAVRWIDPLLRAVVHHPVRTWLVSMALIAALVMPLVLARQVLLLVPATATTAVGAAALVGGLVWSLRGRAARLDEVDEVVAPLDRIGKGPADRPLAVLTTVTTWMIPGATVLLLALVWWLTG